MASRKRAPRKYYVTGGSRKQRSDSKHWLNVAWFWTYVIMCVLAYDKFLRVMLPEIYCNVLLWLLIIQGLSWVGSKGKAAALTHEILKVVAKAITQ